MSMINALQAMAYVVLLSEQSKVELAAINISTLLNQYLTAWNNTPASIP